MHSPNNLTVTSLDDGREMPNIHFRSTKNILEYITYNAIK